MMMPTLKKLRGLAMVLGLTLLASFTVHAQQAKDNNYRDFSNMTPSATMDYDITSVKLIAGASWGTGNLHYQGKVYPLKVKSGTAGGIGYQSVKGTGKVYDLKKLEDFAGIYTGGTAGATIGNKGAGTSTLENGNGVVIEATATDSSGAQLSLSVGGIQVEFAKE
jgi:hypothetical protein